MIRRPMMTAVAGVALGLFGLQDVAVSPSGAAESASSRVSYCTMAGAIAPTPGITYESRRTTYNLHGPKHRTADDPPAGTVTDSGEGAAGGVAGSSTGQHD